MPPAEPPEVSQNESFVWPTDPKTANRRIFVIEDDRDIVETIEHILRSAGHEVKSTTNGKDALRLVELLNPDLVITDVIMPEIDALDAIVILRHRYPALKIIAISGNPHLLTLAAKHGANHVLAKPFNLHQLTLLVKVALQ
jgi:two-component system, cell cycle sensor histidine kinase and response regulator CckA